MKLLLDENLPKKLKQDFLEHEISTVREQGWSGISNGELLKLMIDNGFDALITFDKNLQHQQNFDKYPVSVLVLTAESNQYKHLQVLIVQMKKKLESLPIGYGCWHLREIGGPSELKGISGKLQIIIADGKHSYELAYSLPGK